MTLKEKIRETSDILGLQTMLFQTQEECSELIKAISKYNRINGIGQKTDMSRADAFQNLLEEMADVLICVDGLVYLLGCEREVEEYEKIALNKTLTRNKNKNKK
jgi:NTP pyrophosphatase (non-canonical NTP hydrolase)